MKKLASAGFFFGGAEVVGRIVMRRMGEHMREATRNAKQPAHTVRPTPLCVGA
ncbi:MAG: hypothetical protein JWM42_1209 [Burkholderia sp.]|nr:hypothetical protein [Burkholderia sp.]